MTDTLDEIRDKTIFIEYFPEYCLISVWHADGKFDYCLAGHYATA